MVPGLPWSLNLVWNFLSCLYGVTLEIKTLFAWNVDIEILCDRELQMSIVVFVSFYKAAWGNSIASKAFLAFWSVDFFVNLEPSRNGVKYVCAFHHACNLKLNHVQIGCTFFLSITLKIEGYFSVEYCRNRDKFMSSRMLGSEY